MIEEEPKPILVETPQCDQIKNDTNDEKNELTDHPYSTMDTENSFGDFLLNDVLNEN